MSKKIKSFIYNFIGFAILFFATRYLVETFTTITGMWIPLLAFGVGSIFSPKFQATTTKDGEKLFMKWIFLKDVKEIE